MLDFLIGFFTDYGYWAVFAILIACGFGLPIPEDITLVSGGVISGLGMTNPHWMLVVGLVGVLAGDSTMFLLGRVFGYRIQRIRTFRKILSPRRFSQIQRKFKKYGLGLLFVARFLPGLRSPIFLVAGMSRRISYFTFIAMDGVAALISVPIWIYLGYFFADNLDLLMEYVGDVQKVIYLILIVIVLIVLGIYFKKRLHAKMDKHFGEEKEESNAAPQSASLPQDSAQATVNHRNNATNTATDNKTPTPPTSD
ncbi:MAG: DedA family protein [Candidatus Anaerobiospirillum merdipullorum]|uniref:DedA family protein n=1 Tax=Candidatus Anaerobiospirillum merdipullorum TaxID=2838450 RepID=A0A9E2NSQ1_9GAMM|nr:DedA family protein [Candidatus Anaerobiospirillum merdipullorum]